VQVLHTPEEEEEEEEQVLHISHICLDFSVLLLCAVHLWVPLLSIYADILKTCWHGLCFMLTTR
jgi:hypothetical protein